MSFTIPNIVFVFLIGLTTIYLTFLTTKGNLTDNRFSNIWHKLTKRGKLVFFNLLFMLVLLICQEYNNQNINKNNGVTIETERKQRDSLITAGIKLGVDSSNNKLFTELSQAFAEQGFRFDSLKKEFVKIKDQEKITINNFSEDLPIIRIDKKGIIFQEKNSESNTDPAGFIVKFTSTDAGSANHNITCYLLTHYSDDSYNLSKLNFFPKGLKIPKNGNWEAKIISTQPDKIKNYYLYLKGSYTSLDSSKIIYIDDLYIYEHQIKTVSTLLNNKRNAILKIFKEIPEESLILNEGD